MISFNGHPLNKGRFNDLGFRGPPTPAGQELNRYVVSIKGGPKLWKHVSNVWRLPVWRNKTDEMLDVKISFYLTITFFFLDNFVEPWLRIFEHPILNSVRQVYWKRMMSRVATF